VDTDHTVFLNWCEAKTQKSVLALFIGSILAGAYIGFASQVFTLVTSNSIVSYGFTQLIGGLVFSVGLIMVVLGKADLFTGNCLLSYPCYSSIQFLSKTLINWVIVFIGNFVGSILLAGLYHMAGLFSAGNGIIAQRAYAIAIYKAGLPFAQAFSRGILCNWLVCLAVFICIYAENNLTKLLVIPVPIMTFVALGYEHNVANMYFIPSGIFAQNYIQVDKLIGWSGVFRNLIPVTLGNIVGGTVFVGLFYWIIQGKKKV